MLTLENSIIYSVSQLNQSVRQLLELQLGRVWLNAEISNFSQPASGHWYFTLKDEKAQLRAAMFRGQNIRLNFRPQNGQQVLVRATVTLYEPRGEYQLIIENMQPAGDGLLQRQFEILKQKLSAEGLFAQHYKQALPMPAKRLGVITSATGAALHDILNILKRRDPSLPVIIYPTAVQGEDAPRQIVRAIEVANHRQECDVLIVGRGGGSLEDLWAFNDEKVARAIFASQLPIIAAVGHETDVTIADFVADLRAPTPSAAAELVSRNQQELLRQLLEQKQRLEMAMDYFLARKLRVFSQLHHKLQQQHPELRITRQQNYLIQLQQKLVSATQHYLQQINRQHYSLEQRLILCDPRPQLQTCRQRYIQHEFQLKQLINQTLSQYREKFAINCSRLEAVSPLATLARGYTISELPNGKVLTNTQQVDVGVKLKTRLQDGWLESKILSINKIA
ncbi:exodeoxyribonuclease VII large subunit [Arsenophonus nasoniae]|uniref:Exodeoxyribonuclease 7 large subunit n=1 Tax=Arsenophonus nasoniae TaxID=638 RepID=D2U237_9GAMM|nr:exodeoxyribonuclease VII large subunit [Arsenophonus nasoniae]QBY43764.1 Exodeoxyribonuclease 7 large subunit [Arsenophonus nasoniae]WGM00132.1 exodeoxyribonuclease VII large subunit [Arsenophonus nasoniae]WGM04120.1 exodeoxyribonuclease VII large subunit [Arsenophonus nasoniae]WGM09225.1 exodeoxyribonuclease VII large subunit [Arsenophonus nasoniae]WGM13947.1 exodeoxyribonuclease VII large subunit [Arsenophonus nasoniae]